MVRIFLNRLDPPFIQSRLYHFGPGAKRDYAHVVGYLDGYVVSTYT